MQRANSISTEAMKKIILAFKEVERKIDKLQDDVNTQGKVLNDMRYMVGSLMGGSRSEEDLKSLKRRREKSNDQSPISLKPKATVPSSKINKAKSYDPVVPKSLSGGKRLLKPKKGEIKKLQNRTGRKTTNDN